MHTRDNIEGMLCPHCGLPLVPKPIDKDQYQLTLEALREAHPEVSEDVDSLLREHEEIKALEGRLSV